jgi:hypothetical protein
MRGMITAKRVRELQTEMWVDLLTYLCGPDTEERRIAFLMTRTGQTEARKGPISHARFSVEREIAFDGEAGERLRRYFEARAMWRGPAWLFRLAWRWGHFKHEV